MSFNEWREEKLEDVIEFNPSETIKKGKVVKKIGMEIDALSKKNRRVCSNKVYEWY